MLWITVVEWLARIVLVLLIVLSFWSISIIIERRRFYKDLSLPLDDFQKLIRAKSFSALLDKAKSDQSLIGPLITEISAVKSSEQVERSFDVYAHSKKIQLEKGLSVLGTLGSTTPFIGLLGTILGIIVSFGELSSGGGSTNEVMFSLAEALILTAVGLVVAIPAVVAFNYFSRKSRHVLNELNSVKDLYIAYKD